MKIGILSMRMIWVLAIGLLSVTELLSGTFCLFVLVCGACAGFFSEICGVSWMIQLFVATIVTLVGLLVLLRFKKDEKHHMIVNHPIGLDINQYIFVETWQCFGNTTRARYRGSEWYVQYIGNKDKALLSTGWFVIKDIDGITLLVLDVEKSNSITG